MDDNITAMPEKSLLEESKFVPLLTAPKWQHFPTKFDRELNGIQVQQSVYTGAIGLEEAQVRSLAKHLALANKKQVPRTQRT